MNHPKMDKLFYFLSQHHDKEWGSFKKKFTGISNEYFEFEPTFHSGKNHTNTYNDVDRFIADHNLQEDMDGNFSLPK